MYFLLAFAYQQIERHIPPLVPFSTIYKISVLVKRSNFTLVFLQTTCHANLEAERNFRESNSYISRHIFLRFSNTSANNNALL